MKPTTQYTRSGRINIAYQVFGTGPIDLVYIPGWVSNIDWMWQCPELVLFLQDLGRMARVILFDKRGTGLSDRVVELSTLEERMDDIRAVMDAAGSERAVLFGHSEGGSVSALFAATYPNRTISLITFGIFARRRHSPDYPWAPTDAERQQLYDMIETRWGSSDMNLENLAPSKRGDSAFMEWLANYLRSGASPSAALVLTKMNTEVDIVNILPSIKVPALILQRNGDIDVKLDEGRFIAERIPNARFVALDGEDHLFWIGDTQAILNQMRAFLHNTEPLPDQQEQLFTIVAAHFHPGFAPEGPISELVTRFRGQVVQYRSPRMVAIFEGPSKAVHCSLHLADLLKSHRAQVAIGIHIREAAVRDAHFISPDTGNIVAGILRLAQPGQILITQTVKHLLSGAGLHYRPAPASLAIGPGESLPLYNVTDRIDAADAADWKTRPHIPGGASFLESVLQCIDRHLGDEQFGVDMLCREMAVSERQLQRKLKAVTNKTPNQLISSVRLHRAKELLLQHTHQVSEIAYLTGFSNPSYFAKSFKRVFGISPSSLEQR